MNPLAISGPLASVSSATSILSSVSRIVQSDNWRETEIYAIEKATEVECNKIIHDAKAARDTIDFCYAQILAALGSKKLSSAQKRQIFILMVDKLTRA